MTKLFFRPKITGKNFWAQNDPKNKKKFLVIFPSQNDQTNFSGPKWPKNLEKKWKKIFGHFSQSK